MLLQAVLKYTPDDSPDKKDLPEVISKIKEYLNKVNIESGKSENIFELAQLDQQLEFRANEKIVSTRCPIRSHRWVDDDMLTRSRICGYETRIENSSTRAR